MRLLLTFWILFLAGCGGSAGPAPIYLGHVASTTGPEREAGQEATLGIRLAILELAKEEVKPYGRPVQVIHTDTQGELEAYESEAVRLVKVNKVPALYGGQTPAEVQRLERARVPLVTPAGLAPRQLGEATFSIGISPAIQGQTLARFLMEDQKIERIVVVADERREESQVLVDAFQRELNKDGADNAPAVVVITFGKDAKYTDMAAKAIDTKPAALLFAGKARDFLAFRKELAPSMPLVLFAGDDGSLRPSESGEPVVTVTAFAVDPDLPKTQEFARKFRETFQQVPDVNAALAYDGVRLVVEALGRTQNGEALVEELKKTSEFPSLTGPISFGLDRVLRRPAFVVRLEGGKIVLLKRVNPSR
ncbi:MAG: ABC transporter substrate-binding protein [Planctomycetes bacterium]|nr:ABC transporter substrate-binding protein [Planctomycetota bacterium]